MAQQPIDASAVPVPSLDAGLLSMQASTLRSDAGLVRQGGADVRSSWAGLAGVYHAPEAVELFAVMGPVAAATDSFASDVEQVGSVLESFAAEAGPLAAALAQVKADAFGFASRVAGNGKWDHDGTLVAQNNALVHTVNTSLVAFQAAERRAANAIEALIGGRQWQAIDPTSAGSSVKDRYAYGYTSIPDNARTPWGADVRKKDGCVKSTLSDVGHFAVGVGEGLWGMVKGVGMLVWDASGLGGWQNFKSAWEGLAFLGTLLTPGIGQLEGMAMFGPRGYAQRLEAMGKGLVDWDEWKSDPARAAGNTLANIGTLFIPGADAVGAAADGAKGAELAADAGKAADVANDAGRLSKAADLGETGLPALAKYGDPFTYVEALPKVADLTNKIKLPEMVGLDTKTGSTLEHEMGGWTTHPDEPVPVGAHTDEPVGAHTSGGTDAGTGLGHGGDLGHGGGTGLGHDGSTGLSHDSGAGAGHESGVGTGDHSGGAQGRTTDGGSHGSGSGPHEPPATGGTGHDGTGHEQASGKATTEPPPVQHSVHVDSPGSRTAFTDRTDLEPNTAYHVDGRGTFYTDAHGHVTFVETSSGKTGALNPDLLHPHPDTTYLVDGRHVYHTDHFGRTDHVQVDHLSVGDADRSPSVQSRIGDHGGTGYDGGHLVANMFGGGPEDHNLVAMLEQVNRGGGHSFANLERHWQSLLKTDPSANITVDIRPHYTGGSKVPDTVTVRYQVNGGPEQREVFINE